jgi:hypothetical protein
LFTKNFYFKIFFFSYLEKEMASDALKEERSKLHESAINEHQLATDEGTGTDLIQCRRYDSISF